ncbi:MAG: L-threonylcarbamoyladenylate synthase [Bacillota bacterium]|nr:L-threonylcarbamoyladenylate synthase [Bacillota bacterium]
MTKIYQVAELDERALAHIEEAAAVIRRGGLVAFPTETVYGLGANALDPEAVAGIYRAKGRPSDNPLICHIARASDIGQLTPRLSPRVVKLIENFWPGPLTLVLEKKPCVPDVTTGGLPTVAVRMPDHPVALELIRRADRPVAAPSANLSGRPSPTRAAHVTEDLDGRVDVILAGGDCRVGIESTVLDLTEPVAAVLRPGVLTPEVLSAAIEEEVIFDPGVVAQTTAREDGGDREPERPRSPGMKYRHYAPKAAMTLLEGRRERVEQEIRRLKAVNEAMGLKVGVILFEEQGFLEAAHEFFARLRELDGEGVDLILAGALSDKDQLGFAVMNRMLKSAGYHIVRV